MKDATRGIVGKTISGVIVKEGNSSPRSQVFLLFDDNTYYELYSQDHIGSAGGIDPGGATEVRSYMPEARIVVEELK